MLLLDNAKLEKERTIGMSRVSETENIGIESGERYGFGLIQGIGISFNTRCCPVSLADCPVRLSRRVRHGGRRWCIRAMSYIGLSITYPSASISRQGYSIIRLLSTQLTKLDLSHPGSLRAPRPHWSDCAKIVQNRKRMRSFASGIMHRLAFRVLLHR